MCNNVIQKITPIPESGIGWKIFSLYKGKLYPMGVPNFDLILNLGISFEIDKKYIWNDDLYDNLYDNFYYVNKTRGFCFFDDKIEAEKIRNNWTSYAPLNSIPVIYLINYYDGITKEEKNLTGGIFYPLIAQTCLCKSFKIIKEEKE